MKIWTVNPWICSGFFPIDFNGWKQKSTMKYTNIAEVSCRIVYYNPDIYTPCYIPSQGYTSFFWPEETLVYHAFLSCTDTKIEQT